MYLTLLNNKKMLCTLGNKYILYHHNNLLSIKKI